MKLCVLKPHYQSDLFKTVQIAVELKLMSHTMKLRESVIEHWLRNQNKAIINQFGAMLG